MAMPRHNFFGVSRCDEFAAINQTAVIIPAKDNITERTKRSLRYHSVSSPQPNALFWNIESGRLFIINKPRVPRIPGRYRTKFPVPPSTLDVVMPSMKTHHAAAKTAPEIAETIRFLTFTIEVCVNPKKPTGLRIDDLLLNSTVKTVQQTKL